MSSVLFCAGGRVLVLLVLQSLQKKHHDRLQIVGLHSVFTTHYVHVKQYLPRTRGCSLSVLLLAEGHVLDVGQLSSARVQLETTDTEELPQVKERRPFLFFLGCCSPSNQNFPQVHLQLRTRQTTRAAPAGKDTSLRLKVIVTRIKIPTVRGHGGGRDVNRP